MSKSTYTSRRVPWGFKIIHLLFSSNWFRLNDDFGCYSLPLEFLEQSFFRAFFTHKFHNIHGFVLFSFIFWSRIKFVFLRIIAIVITHRILDYGSCPSNFILVLSFIVLFSYVIASQHRSQHQGNYLHRILFWRSDYCPSNCFHVPHSLQFFVPFLSLSLSFHTPNHLWIHTKF